MTEPENKSRARGGVELMASYRPRVSTLRKKHRKLKKYVRHHVRSQRLIWKRALGHHGFYSREWRYREARFSIKRYARMFLTTLKRHSAP